MTLSIGSVRELIRSSAVDLGYYVADAPPSPCALPHEAHPTQADIDAACSFAAASHFPACALAHAPTDLYDTPYITPQQWTDPLPWAEAIGRTPYIPEWSVRATAHAEPNRRG